MKPAEFLKQHSGEIVLYDKMRTAIVECMSIDEVREIRNKAHAIEVYAAQALNYEAESQAIKIRLRAERRCGELLKESKDNGTRQKPGDNPRGVNSRIDRPLTPTLADLGISKQQSSDWQKLAEIPEEKFEAKLNDCTVRPSTSELIDKKPPPGKKVTADVIYVWGRIRDFEQEPEECLKRDPRQIYDGMSDTMQADVNRIVPQLVPWLMALSRRYSDEG